MNNKNTELLGETNVKKALVTLSVPAMIGMLVNATYNLVDSLFVGWGAGELAIGGLTLAYPVQMIVIAIALMLGVGGASVFSRAYGRNDKEMMNSTLNTSLTVGIVSGILLTIFGLLFVTPLLRFFGAGDNNIGYAQDYLSVILLGVTFQTISMILNNFTRAEGRAKVAMKSLVIATGLNIILDPIFIFDWGLGLGVQGAAIATVISQITAFLYITKSAFDKDSMLAISLTKMLKIDVTALKETIAIGLPTFVRNALGAFLTILILRLIEFYGEPDTYESVQAMYGAGYRVLMFLLMPAFGVVQGFAPIAGYNYGAKKWDRLVELVKYARNLLFICFVGGFILAELGATFIYDIYSTSNDAFFIQEGARIFRIMTGGLIFISIQVIAGAVFQAFGYSGRALFVSLSRQFVFFIPLSFIATLIFGLDGLWITFLVSDVLSGIISYFMLRKEIIHLEEMVEMPSENRKLYA